METVRLGASICSAQGHMCAFVGSRDEENRVLRPFVREAFHIVKEAFHIVDPAGRTEHARRLQEAV
jgi:hypothetical protein